jgi:hypothetical protein
MSLGREDMFIGRWVFAPSSSSWLIALDNGIYGHEFVVDKIITREESYESYFGESGTCTLG